MILIEVAQTKSSTFNNYCSLSGDIINNKFISVLFFRKEAQNGFVYFLCK